MASPTLENVPYGSHPSQCLDLWRPDAARPVPVYVFIHGGGFRGGDKTALPDPLRDRLLAAGIAIAAVNYRLSDVAPYPAAMRDGVRAIQLIRSKAVDWKLDKTRLAAGGGSAGSGITFWIGFRPDFADPAAADPVARESTRLTCIASWQAQSSYDPRFIRSLISGSAYRHPALLQFFRLQPEAFETPEARRIHDEVHFIGYATRQAPPVFLWYKTPAHPMTPDLPENAGIHHPAFGVALKARLETLGVPCELRTRADNPETDEAKALDWFCREQADFLRRHLRPDAREARA